MSFNKTAIFIFLSCILTQPATAQRQPKVSLSIEEKYRGNFSKGFDPVEFLIIDNAGISSDTQGFDPKNGIFIMRLSNNSSTQYFYCAELNMLLKNGYHLESVNINTIRSGNADYFIVHMMRPIEYKDEITTCRLGRADEKSYLISVSNNKLKIIDRDFPKCGSSAEVIKTDDKIGYTVTDILGGSVTDFLIINGKLEKQPTRLIEQEK